MYKKENKSTIFEKFNQNSFGHKSDQVKNE